MCPTDAIVGGIEQFPEEEEKVSDLVASAYTFSTGLACLVFPIVGSALVKSFGFRMGFDIISIVLVLNSVLYLVSAIVDWRKERKELARFSQEAEEKRHLLSDEGDLV